MVCTKETVKSNGLNIWSDEAADGSVPKVDIIAVQGLGAHPYYTWVKRVPTGTAHQSKSFKDKAQKLWKGKKPQREGGEASSTEVMWLRDFLVPMFKNARIATYSYHSDWKDSNIKTSLRECAEQFLNILSQNRQHANECQRPIVLIGHSFGGIVIQQALVIAALQQEFANIRLSVAGIIFLGAPFQGSDAAVYGKWLARLSGHDQTLLKLLEKDSSSLHALSRDFWGSHSDWDLVCFYEKMEGNLRLLKAQIVSSQSASLVGKRMISLNTDHSGLNKYGKENDEDLALILPEIQRMIEVGSAIVIDRFRAKGVLNTVSTQPSMWLYKLKEFVFVEQFAVPFDRDLRFVGREDIIQEITERFKTQHRIALCGIGGIGKSQIAIEYCYLWKERYPRCHIFWIHASTRDRFEQAYRTIGRDLSIPGVEDPIADSLKIVQDWLKKPENGPWLLVLDNADDLDLFYGSDPSAEELGSPHISDLLPRASNGLIIITTRDRRVGQRLTDREEIIMILPLTPSNAEQLLRYKIPKEESADMKEIQILLEILGFIPLAITQAAAFIQENSIAVATYISNLQKSDSDLQDYLDEDLPDPRRYPRSENSVIRTWKISFDQIAKQRPRAAELLSLMAVLDRQGIPRSFLQQDSDRTIEFDKAIGTLKAYSLITIEKGGSSFEIHRLVQISMQRWLKLQSKDTAWQENALLLMAEKFPSGEYGTWQACEDLLPHAKVVIKYQNTSKSVLFQWTQLAQNLARYDKDQGRFDVAYLQYKDLLQKRISILGEKHPETLISMNNLALVLDSQGKYDEAEAMHRQALELKREVLGEKHPETLTSMNNLARVLNSQGKYNEAEAMHRQALELKREVLGEKHPSTLTSINNLAFVLNSQGKYNEAETIYRQELQLSIEVLGEKHPSTLTSMNNLARVLDSQGKYDEAEAMHRQALELKREVLGEKHPETLISMNNLALVLNSQGKYNEAKAMHRQALELKREVLSEKHPETLTSMNNLAGVLNSQGKYDEAEAMHRQALELYKEVLGEKLPDTLTSMNNLARVLNSQGKYNEAEAMHRQALELKREVLGEKHPSTLTSMNNLAFVLNSQGKYDEAESLFRQTLQLSIEVLGEKHPETLTSMNNFAGVLDNQGKYDEAEAMHRQELQLSIEVLGEKHPETLTSMNNLAGVLDSQGKYNEAESLFRQTLLLREEVLGKKHPYTLKSIFSLASFLKEQGNISEALKLFQEEYDRCKIVYGPDHKETLGSGHNLADMLEFHREPS